MGLGTMRQCMRGPQRLMIGQIVLPCSHRPAA